MEKNVAIRTHALPPDVLARRWVWPEALYETSARGFGEQDRQMRVWLHLADRRVLALRLAHLTAPDDRVLAPIVAALAGDVRGVQQGLELPGVGYVHVLYAAPAAPPPAISAHDGRIQGSLRWAPGLDGEVLEALQRLRGTKFYLSVRNYNRLATLPEPVRSHRLQALNRFPALVAPLLLTAHQYPNCFDGQRHAWRHPDPAVEAAMDAGRDLAGALARHYGISRGLVRAAVNAEYWEAGYEQRRSVLRFLDRLPANKRPASAASLQRAMNDLTAYLGLFGEDGTVPQELINAPIHARAFALGWEQTWDTLNQRHAPLYQSFRDAEDFLAAASREIACLTKRRRGPGQRRMALAWITAHGLLGLLRDSARWHAWQARQALPPPTAPQVELPALIGQHEEGGFVARELLSAEALALEGHEMHHCVASYWGACIDGERIFALRAPDGRRATAQFVPRHDPRQAFAAVYRLEQLSGPCNVEVADDLDAFAHRLAALINAPEREAARRAALRFASEIEPPPAPPLPGLDPASRARLPVVMAALDLAPLGPETLLTAFVAGYDYHDGPRLEAEGRARFAPGEALTLAREPDNPHDALAVRILWRGFHLGYVPRPENADIAQRLNAGERLTCRLLTFDANAPSWRRIEFVIEEGPHETQRKLLFALAGLPALGARLRGPDRPHRLFRDRRAGREFPHGPGHGFDRLCRHAIGLSALLAHPRGGRLR